MQNGKRIVISGGPGTGKTAVIEELEKRGHTCIPELVRSLTAAEKKGDGATTFKTNPIVSVENAEAFNQKLLKGRTAQYASTEKANGNLIFFDRGIPDVHAYMNCFGQAYDAAFERPAYDFRYDLVLLMPPWREIYVTDGERFESYEESERIFESLEETYRDFGYETVLVPKASIRERANFIESLVIG